MKKITALCFCLALWNSAAAQQKFYEFLWHGKFGITDADGKEIISPAFASQENLPFASKFIALTNDAGKAIIINKETGKVEDFDHISEVTFRNEADLLLGNKNGNSFLIDEVDDAKRSRMPKYYTTVWQLGEYLVCFTKFNGNIEGTADILRKNDLRIVKENLATKEVYEYKNPDTGKKSLPYGA